MSYDFLTLNILLKFASYMFPVVVMLGLACWFEVLTKKQTGLAFLVIAVLAAYASYKKTPVRFTLTDDTPAAVRSEVGAIKSSNTRQSDDDRLQETRDEIELNK